MDNNFNQQAPQQPVYQQAPQQMPQQQMYQPVPKKPSTVNMTEIIALILSCVGALMAVIGSIMTCSCSASKSLSFERYKEWYKDGAKGDYDVHKASLVLIVAIIGAVIAAVGMVMAIIALKQKDAAIKAGKLSYVALAVGAFGVIYGILPVLTICGYNCSLDSAMKKK